MPASIRAAILVLDGMRMPKRRNRAGGQLREIHTEAGQPENTAKLTRHAARHP